MTKEKAYIQMYCPRCKLTDTVMEKINDDVTQYSCNKCGMPFTLSMKMYKNKDVFEYKVVDWSELEEDLNKYDIEGWEFCSWKINSFRVDSKMILKRVRKVKVEDRGES